MRFRKSEVKKVWFIYFVLIGARSVLVLEAEIETNKNKLEVTVQKKITKINILGKLLGFMHLKKIQMKEQRSHSRVSVHKGKSLGQFCNTVRK